MKPLSIQEILPLPEYEKKRSEIRKRMIEFKKDRRVQVGDLITIAFENRDTIRYQIQEMMRVERIAEVEKIEGELAAYNPLIPGDRELSATLFIEITEETKIQGTLDRMMGIDNGRCVFLKIGEERIPAVFEAGHSKEDKISAVHYLRFSLSEKAARGLANLTVPANILVDHPAYQAEEAIPPALRASLLADLGHTV